jgi:signal transduction histidine kinase
MVLKFALVLSMLLQLGAAVFAITLIRRTRYNISWVLISAGLVLMALRRLFDFSTYFWESSLFRREEVNGWIGVLISVFMLIGVIFIRKIFNLQDSIEQLRHENEQKILSAIINTEEKERQNFARELHDGLGPVLSSIKMTLSAVKPESLTPVNREIINKAFIASNSSIITLKEIANNLSPHLLKNYGLEKAIETFANQLFSGADIDFDVIMDFDDSRFSDELKISCYRIVSELINNSMKHAKPSVINLEIKDSDKFLTIKYKDNGCGFVNFQTEKNSNLPGMGFNNINSRTKSLNGMYHIETAPGNGFSVEFYFPLK